MTSDNNPDTNTGTCTDQCRAQSRATVRDRLTAAGVEYDVIGRAGLPAA
ncbi:hypothetical protein I3U40_18270 [Mycobacteroides abscessus subsp. abscessus]|nr:hypothetical protein [Mycobacteroides abscessus]QSM93002.1 hypothetical protein I3U31_18260 [Mycobacteroides abscessus subsp. abscessus]QSM98040.1 hypothetical protein I3U40_18270 [Mycobacteroides abscessus subsp. abscessus]SLI40792.1 Uncharacterised protein [Mycobacteroides abscessus subsp. abscessus]